MDEQASWPQRIWNNVLKHKRSALLLLAAALLLFVAGSRYGVYLAARQAAAEPAVKALEQPQAEPILIAVDIKGAVARPGLYWFEKGQRVAEALEQAGLLEEADTDLLNLAAPLSDGQSLIVPYMQLDEQQRQQRYAQLAEEGGFSNGLVNINSARLAALQTLPGIGETKAQAIIDHREQQGPFTSIEQLTGVPGIGTATLEQLRELVCVE